jgi:hypothetical protein
MDIVDNHYRYCNTLALIDSLVDERQDVIGKFKCTVPRLIKEIKDRTDAVRKRSAVTMAKLARDPEMLVYIRSLHGMELLLSLKN